MTCKDAAFALIQPGRSTTRILTSSSTVADCQCAIAGSLLRGATCSTAAYAAARSASASTIASVAGTRGPGGTRFRPVEAATSLLKICMGGPFMSTILSRLWMRRLIWLFCCALASGEYLRQVVLFCSDGFVVSVSAAGVDREP